MTGRVLVIKLKKSMNNPDTFSDKRILFDMMNEISHRVGLIPN